MTNVATSGMRTFYQDNQKVQNKSVNIQFVTKGGSFNIVSLHPIFFISPIV